MQMILSIGPILQMIECQHCTLHTEHITMFSSTFQQWRTHWTRSRILVFFVFCFSCFLVLPLISCTILDNLQIHLGASWKETNVKEITHPRRVWKGSLSDCPAFSAHSSHGNNLSQYWSLNSHYLTIDHCGRDRPQVHSRASNVFYLQSNHRNKGKR